MEQHYARYLLTFLYGMEVRHQGSRAGDNESGEESRACSLPGPSSLAKHYQLSGSPERLQFRGHTLKHLSGAHRSHKTNQVCRSNNEEWRLTTGMNTDGLGNRQKLLSSSQLLSCRNLDLIVIRLADFPEKSETSLDGDFNL